MRWRVVTPPTVASANGRTSSDRVFSVHRVSESTSTAMSPDDAQYSDAERVASFAGDRRMDPRDGRGELVPQTASRPGWGAVDDDDDLVRALGHHSAQDFAEQVSGSSTTGTMTLVEPK